MNKSSLPSNRSTLWFMSWLLVMAVIIPLATVANAQEAPPATQPAAKVKVPKNLSTPRATLNTFFIAMNELKENPEGIEEAVKCLDLSGLASTIVSDSNELHLLAHRLFKILKPHEYEFAYGDIHDLPEGDPIDLLEEREGSVIINQVEDGRWLFSAETVTNIPELFKTLSKAKKLAENEEESDPIELWIEARIPDSLRKEWLGLGYWQWIGIFLLIFVGIILDQIVRIVISVFLERIFRNQKVEIDKQEKARGVRPFGLIVMGLTWCYGLPFLLLPLILHDKLLPAVKIITNIAIVWAVYKLIDLVCDYFMAKAVKTISKYDDLLVPIIRKTLKIMTTIVAFVFLADIFNLPLTNVIAGLGIGGLAIGFAARETLQNFFGSITVLLDRPFNIGDWVKIGDVEGAVENVGFRTTRIRTFYNSLITVPNMMLTTQTIDNLGARKYRRIKAMISVTYDTPPEKIDAFCEGIRELIRQHPYTRKDYYHVYFNEFANSSLNILLYCFHETPDWPTELRERHRLFNDILRLAQKLGVEFAFPTQTIHLQQESATAKTAPPDLSQDPMAVGRQSAFTVVAETGLTNKTPPPVSFNPIEFHGGEDADEN